MGEPEKLLAVLAALYLSECVVWLRHGSVLIRSGGLRRPAIVHPSKYFGNEKGGFALLNPIPPFGSAFVCHQWPLTLTSDFACSYVAQAINFERRAAQDAVLVRLDHVREVRQSSGVITVGGAHFTTLGDEPRARRFAALLQRLAALSALEREDAIAGELAATTDSAAVRQRIDFYQRSVVSLRRLCNLLFITLFVGVPLSVWSGRFVQLIPFLLALLTPCWLMTLWTFYMAHGTLFPQSLALRRAALARMLFMPTSAIRACDVITRHLLSQYDPLAVAACLCDRNTLASFAKKILADLTYPLLPVCPPGPAIRLEGSFRGRLRGCLEGLLRRCDIDPEGLIAPPLREHVRHQSYCPRCLTQYLIAAGHCDPCGGRELKPFAETNKPPNGNAVGEHLAIIHATDN